VKVVISEGQIV